MTANPTCHCCGVTTDGMYGAFCAKCSDAGHKFSGPICAKCERSSRIGPDGLTDPERRLKEAEELLSLLYSTTLAFMSGDPHVFNGSHYNDVENALRKVAEYQRAKGATDAEA